MLKKKKKPFRIREKEQLESDKGFTLIEMLLCALMSCIVISAIGGFMTTAIRQYNSADREVSLQTESQTVLNQITAMVKGADNVVYRQTGTDAYAIIYIGIDGAASTKDGKDTKIVWYHASSSSTESGKMYLSEPKNAGEFDTAIASINSGSTTGWNLMGNYLNGFKMWVNDGTSTGRDLSSGIPDDKNTVSMEIKFLNQFKKDKKEYTATNTIKLRNQVIKLP